jgi:hypothetical protein
MPHTTWSDPPNSTDLGAYRTPDLARLMLLSNLLFRLIFTASKVEVARSNRAGQAKNLKQFSGYHDYRVVLVHYIVIAQLTRKRPRILA